MITIAKPGLKRKLIDACVAKQQIVIENFKTRIRNLTESNGRRNNESYDEMDRAETESRIAEINTLNELLEVANGERELLSNLKITQDLTHEKVVLGAVVFTDHNAFFIAASVEEFGVDGKKYVGISTRSPLYHAMSGKAIADTFTFKGKLYTITDIF